MLWLVCVVRLVVELSWQATRDPASYRHEFWKIRRFDDNLMSLPIFLDVLKVLWYVRSYYIFV